MLTAALTFVATNVDDLLILVLLFSQVGAGFGRRHIVAGQTLGFAALVAASLALGVVGALVIPDAWLGLLGLVPIALGVKQLLDRDDDEAEAARELVGGDGRGLLAAPTFQVAALTIANGGDNVGVYVPLFARSSPAEILGTLAVFFALMGLLLLFGYRLTRQPRIAALTARYSHVLMPVVLILLGVAIILESL